MIWSRRLRHLSGQDACSQPVAVSVDSRLYETTTAPGHAAGLACCCIGAGGRARPPPREKGPVRGPPTGLPRAGPPPSSGKSGEGNARCAANRCWWSSKREPSRWEFGVHGQDQIMPAANSPMVPWQIRGPRMQILAESHRSREGVAGLAVFFPHPGFPMVSFECRTH